MITCTTRFSNVSRRSRTILVALCAVGLGAGTFGASSAALGASYDNMYKTANASWDCTDRSDLYCRTDNGYLTFGIEPGMTTAGDNDVRNSIHGEYGPTDLEVHEHVGSAIDYSGANETDIVYDWRDPALPAGTLGITWCDDATNGSECDQHYVSFDHMGGGSANPWMAAVCHETGHAVGLTHGHEASPRISQTDSSLGCMRTESLTVDERDLGSHNVSQINGAYTKP